jgi:hypothetical protein
MKPILMESLYTIDPTITLSENPYRAQTTLTDQTIGYKNAKRDKNSSEYKLQKSGVAEK